MSSLSAFLHPVQIANKEVVVSDRFQENGKPVPFVIRPISQEENSEIIKRCTKKLKNNEQFFDRIAYNETLVASAVVEPDPNNAELQKAYGVLGARALLTKMLYAGEYARLFQEIQKMSGIDVDINTEIEEAKNE